MFSRYLVVALVLVCAKAECQTKPLSLNGVRLGQKWSEFLKAHPKAEVFSLGVDMETRSRAEQLAEEAKQKEASLLEEHKGELFTTTFYSFYNGSLSRAIFLAGFNGREKGLDALKAPLNKLLVALGTPTAQGVTRDELGDGHRLMLAWKTPTQSAYALINWQMPSEDSGPTGIVLQIVHAPWRAVKTDFKPFWPSILAANKEDEERRRQLTALMEQLRPHSTEGIQELKPAPAIDPSPKRK